MSDLRTADVKAWERWKAAHRSTFVARTLGETDRRDEFLENRLWHCFMAAFKAGYTFQSGGTMTVTPNDKRTAMQSASLHAQEVEIVQVDGGSAEVRVCRPDGGTTTFRLFAGGGADLFFRMIGHEDDTPAAGDSAGEGE